MFEQQINFISNTHKNGKLIKSVLMFAQNCYRKIKFSNASLMQLRLESGFSSKPKQRKINPGRKFSQLTDIYRLRSSDVSPRASLARKARNEIKEISGLMLIF